MPGGCESRFALGSGARRQAFSFPRRKQFGRSLPKPLNPLRFGSARPQIVQTCPTTFQAQARCKPAAWHQPADDTASPLCQESSQLPSSAYEKPERSTVELEAKLRFIGKEADSFLIDRVRTFREMVRLERRRNHNNLIAATKELCRILGDDVDQAAL